MAGPHLTNCGPLGGLDRAPLLTLLLSHESVIHVVEVVLSLHSSPTHVMEALRHEHCCILVEGKGKGVWILNGLVDATHHGPWTIHHGETETADQNTGLVDLHSRKGNGRAANGDRPIGCRREQQMQGDMPTPPRRPWCLVVVVVEGGSPIFLGKPPCSSKPL